MKNLLFAAVVTILFTSCQKDLMNDQIKSSQLTITFTDGYKPTFSVSLYKDIELRGTSLYFIPNTNCPMSVQFCNTFGWNGVKSYKEYNIVESDCK